eukprot:507042-Pyramimonas_sp.AAC.1
MAEIVQLRCDFSPPPSLLQWRLSRVPRRFSPLRPAPSADGARGAASAAAGGFLHLAALTGTSAHHVARAVCAAVCFSLIPRAVTRARARFVSAWCPAKACHLQSPCRPPVDPLVAVSYTHLRAHETGAYL